MNTYKLIILEDQEDDAQSICLELQKLEPSFETAVTRNRMKFQREFDKYRPDLVIAEYQLPDFTGLEALEMARSRDPDIPFILCSDNVGEELVVDAIRQGVNDYARKDNLQRLGASVIRELRPYDTREQENSTETRTLRLEREDALRRLKERVKEQTCLYRISAVETGSIDELLQESVEYLSPGWQYPDITEACICLQEVSHTTADYRETDWALKTERKCRDGRLLRVCVVYLKQRPAAHRDVFLKEEIQLIESIADHLILKIDRLLAQQELLEKERQLQAMSEISRTGYWELDVRDQSVLWSPITRSIHEVEEDYTPDLEKAINFYKEGRYRDTLRHRVQEAMEQGRPFDEELLLVTAKGRENWVRAIGEPVRENGTWIKLRGSFQDIDERKRAQLASQRNRLLLETITCQAETPIWVHDEEGRYIFVNKEWRHLFQKLDVEVLGKTVFDLFERENAEAFHERDRQVLESGTSRKFEESITGPDGTRYFLTTRFPMKDIPEIGKGVGGVATEITERKANEQHLLKSLREKELLLEEIHHRVKNNLAIISSLLSLQADDLEDEGSKTILQNSQNRIHSIAMVHELLYQAGNLADVSLDEYVNNLVDALWNTIGSVENKIEIVTKISVSDFNINQAIPLGLLLNEVITNSLKHAFGKQDEGWIGITIKRRGTAIEVRYEDNGGGYPEGTSFDDTGTVGLMLIQTLLKQLDAEYNVDTRGFFLLEILFEEEGEELIPCTIP